MTEPYDQYIAALYRLDRLPSQAAQDEQRLVQRTSEEAEAARAEEREARKAARGLREQVQEKVDQARKLAIRVGLEDRLQARIPPREGPTNASPERLQAAVDRLAREVHELERARQVASEEARADAEKVQGLERERRRYEGEVARRAEARRRRRRRILVGSGVVVVFTLLLVALGQLGAFGAVAGGGPSLAIRPGTCQLAVTVGLVSRGTPNPDLPVPHWL